MTNATLKDVDGMSEEHRLFREHVRKFCQQEIAPLVDEAEATESFPTGLFPRLGAAGLLCPTFPERYGAAGADTVTFCILAEELGRVCSGIAGSVIAHSSIGTSAILEHGTEAQRERWLPAAVRGESVFAFALTEPNAGSDVKSIDARAVRVGGGYVIDGAKSFITNGGICTHALVAARTASGDDGISLFVVPSRTEGFVVDGKVKKLGNRSSDCVFLHLEGCHVPEDARIGAEGQGFTMLMRSLGCGRMVVAARAVGLGEAALAAALAYARDRRQFGRRIADFQATQLKLARMATCLRAARLMVYDAARAKDRGEDVTMAAAMAKLFATETCNAVADDALQIHGAYGYSREFPVERYYRDARLTTIVEGTSEIQQLIIARGLI